jgi:hypothetical protein
MFTTLIHGFCAYLHIMYGQPLVGIGYLSQGACISHVSIGDTKDTDVVYGDHAFSVKILDESASPAAEITVDGMRKFIVSLDERA